MGHAELNLDPARTPGGFGQSRPPQPQHQQQLSPPSIHVSPESVHAQMLTDPSRTPQTTPMQPKDALINPSNNVNVNGFEELTAAAAVSKHIPSGRVIHDVASGSDDDDDDDDDDDGDDDSTTTSWSEEESPREGWSDRAWSEDDRVSFDLGTDRE